MEIKRGIAICHYNRTKTLKNIIQAVKSTAPKDAIIVVCDDGSDQGNVHHTCIKEGVTLIAGPNLGVAFNKNRALLALQDCHFIAILEDDIMPTAAGWFEEYERAVTLTGIHHFCRVPIEASKELETPFDAFMKDQNLTPIYGETMRGDFSFFTKKVVQEVGGFNKAFKGTGYAHIEWLYRITTANLIPSPNVILDIKEASSKFKDSLNSKTAKPADIIEKETEKNLEVYKKETQELKVFQEISILDNIIGV